MMQRLLRFTLDLFESEPVPEPAVAERGPKLKKKVPLAQSERAQPAIEIIASDVPDEAGREADAVHLAPQTLAQALAPATFRHPRATREALLEGIAVGYEFKRGKRRTIGFSVGVDGMTVSAPKWVPLYEIDKAVLEKSGWILNKLRESRDRRERLESTRIEWKDGATLPFLGEPVRVVIDSRHRPALPGSASTGAQLHTDAQPPPGAPRLTLYVSLPHDAAPERIRDAVQAWLMRQAKRIFEERLNHFAPQLGVRWNKLSLSNAGTRWGSATADGAIRLHWRLVHFRMSVIDYVVAHELSHLRVMDHSPRFWSTVESIMPDYADRKSQLKDEAIPRWQ